MGQYSGMTPERKQRSEDYLLGAARRPLLWRLRLAANRARHRASPIDCCPVCGTSWDHRRCKRCGLVVTAWASGSASVLDEER